MNFSRCRPSLQALSDLAWTAHWPLPFAQSHPKSNYYSSLLNLLSPRCRSPQQDQFSIMDRIERVEDSTSNGGSNLLRPPTQEAFPAFPEEAGSQQQPFARPQPRLRHRNRQPSIRLRRLSSVSSLEHRETAGSTEQFPQLTPQSTTEERSSIPLTDQSQDDSWEANRRRSNSEPRPGRYSAPPIIVTSGIPISQQHPMSPVKEETGSLFRPSTDLNNAERFAVLRDISPTASGDGGLAPQETSALEEYPTGATPRPGMLRRASAAALSAIGRNRASTVAGGDPAQHSPAPDEYDSRIVDFLDVIGKFCSPDMPIYFT